MMMMMMMMMMVLVMMVTFFRKPFYKFSVMAWVLSSHAMKSSSN